MEHLLVYHTKILIKKVVGYFSRGQNLFFFILDKIIQLNKFKVIKSYIINCQKKN